MRSRRNRCARKQTAGRKRTKNIERTGEELSSVFEFAKNRVSFLGKNDRLSSCITLPKALQIGRVQLSIELLSNQGIMNRLKHVGILTRRGKPLRPVIPIRPSFRRIWPLCFFLLILPIELGCGQIPLSESGGMQNSILAHTFRPFHRLRQDEAFRREVAADPFPSAHQPIQPPMPR